jgi:hypothetical protein
VGADSECCDVDQGAMGRSDAFNRLFSGAGDVAITFWVGVIVDQQESKWG